MESVNTVAVTVETPRQSKPYRRSEASKQKQLLYRHANRARLSAKSRAWYAANKERHAALRKAYYAKNRAAVLDLGKEYYLQNKSAIRARERERYASDINFRIRRIVRNHARKVAIRGERVRPKTLQFLGCTVSQLRAHLEKQFKPGMTWDNYGLRGWHIDHIIPLAALDLTDDGNMRKVLHYTNLQPLWWRENISKGCRIQAPVQLCA